VKRPMLLMKTECYSNTPDLLSTCSIQKDQDTGPRSAWYADTPE